MASVQASEAVCRFHDKCGRNIKLRDNNTTAKRGDGCPDGDGIVIAQKPMECNKLYEVQLEKADDAAGKPQGVCLGVVTSLPKKESDVPKEAKGWSDAVVIDGDGVSVDGKFTKSETGQALVDLPKVCRVGVCLDLKRHLSLYVEGKDKGLVHPEELPDPCYFMFELLEPYKQITLEVKPLDNPPEEVSEPEEASSPQVAVAKQRARGPPQQPSCEGEVRDFKFHDIYKRNAELSNDNHRATRSTEDESDGIVISDEPMESNMLYTVKIKKKRANERTCTLFVGVVTLPTEGPEGTEAPDSADDWPDAVVFKPGEVTVRGVPWDGLWGSELSRLTENSEVGIGKDNAGHIYLKINRCRFRPPIDLPEGPYHAMFCMKSGCESIETCGLIKLPTGQRQ